MAEFNPFQSGERLAEKYELTERLGAGGLGSVFAARHLGFDSQVALKFLHPEYASQPEMLACFKREARAGFHIDNKHVVRVIDLEELADGTPFIVMERLYGTDLQRLLASVGRLSTACACDYVLEVCTGLRAAHALGIIHRDIKPGNLFLVSTDHEPEVEPHIKLLDFGISKLCTGTHLVQTAPTTQVALGTPEYMSPEQVRGAADLDTRSDIWSLGCVLYELLTGVAPFRRSTIMHSCAAVLEDEPPAPDALIADIPAGLSALVMRCLSKEKSLRPQTVEELAETLPRFGSAARSLPLLAARVQQPPDEIRHAPRRRRWMFALVAALALAAVLSVREQDSSAASVVRVRAHGSQSHSELAPEPPEPQPPEHEIASTSLTSAPPRHRLSVPKPRRGGPAPAHLAPRKALSEPDVGF